MASSLCCRQITEVLTNEAVLPIFFPSSTFCSTFFEVLSYYTIYISESSEYSQRNGENSFTFYPVSAICPILLEKSLAEKILISTQMLVVISFLESL